MNLKWQVFFCVGNSVQITSPIVIKLLSSCITPLGKCNFCVTSSTTPKKRTLTRFYLLNSCKCNRIIHHIVPTNSGDTIGYPIYFFLSVFVFLVCHKFSLYCKKKCKTSNFIAFYTFHLDKENEQKNSYPPRTTDHFANNH